MFFLRFFKHTRISWSYDIFIFSHLKKETPLKEHQKEGQPSKGSAPISPPCARRGPEPASDPQRSPGCKRSPVPGCRAAERKSGWRGGTPLLGVSSCGVVSWGFSIPSHWLLDFVPGVFQFFIGFPPQVIYFKSMIIAPLDRFRTNQSSLTNRVGDLIPLGLVNALDLAAQLGPKKKRAGRCGSALFSMFSS